MAKKDHKMTTQEEFDNHSNQLNPNHLEYQKVHPESKKSGTNASKGRNNSGHKGNPKK